MTKLEYSDLYKFLVSLGIVLISLSLIVPWLFLRESFDALLKASDISDLTPTAQALLSYRQQAALWFVRNVWWISLTLAISGLLPLVMGITLWIRRQRVLDQREEIETRKVGLEVEKLKREMESLTPTEIAMKAIEEITEEVEAEEAPQPLAIDSIKTSIQEYLRVEEIFFSRLVACYGNERVLIQQGAKDVAYDAILKSDNPALADVVFEVKRLTRHLGLDRVRAAAEQISHLIQSYALLTNRLTTTVVGIVLFVVPEEDRDSVRMQEYLWATKDQAQLYSVRVHPIFITEKELLEITCSELETKINRIAAVVP
jgi:hypothetical protein